MRRRTYLTGLAGAGAAALAGCSGIVETRAIPSSPPVLSNRPSAVYFPTHVEGMSMSGMGKSGEYQFGLMYSYPHRFWNVNGTSTSMTEIQEDDDVHLMASVWDPETGTVLPDTGLTIEISRGGELVSEEVIYPMLSQPMGFHYGANFGLDGDGTYTVTVSVGGVNTRRVGGFEGRFADPASADIAFEYAQSARDEILFERTMDRAGEAAARPPMEMGMMPLSVLPEADDLPGTTRGETSTGDATLVVQSLDTVPSGVDGEGAQYLYVSARTPYNRMVVPAMGLEGTLTRDGETVFEGELTRTLHPEAKYHYGAAVPSVESGDTLGLSVTVPPQVARHEGYETAFVEMPDTEVTLS
ncbi:iron transporter [Salinirubellus salinus]|jgi:hypothetical protein|uniref:Iron transporter n=1 Tax=Salinirubellus salinus TaxID=1364945 RepID=A0A9E7R1S5_9EURY|nr:iron transporter [Salinirubellus salinus]UWM54170.1 iron transporter [Salinirubellus salinus]